MDPKIPANLTGVSQGTGVTLAQGMVEKGKQLLSLDEALNHEPEVRADTSKPGLLHRSLDSAKSLFFKPNGDPTLLGFSFMALGLGLGTGAISLAMGGAGLALLPTPAFPVALLALFASGVYGIVSVGDFGISTVLFVATTVDALFTSSTTKSYQEFKDKIAGDQDVPWHNKEAYLEAFDKLQKKDDWEANRSVWEQDWANVKRGLAFESSVNNGKLHLTDRSELQRAYNPHREIIPKSLDTEAVKAKMEFLDHWEKEVNRAVQWDDAKRTPKEQDLVQAFPEIKELSNPKIVLDSNTPYFERIKNIEAAIVNAHPQAKVDTKVGNGVTPFEHLEMVWMQNKSQSATHALQQVMIEQVEIVSIVDEFIGPKTEATKLLESLSQTELQKLAVDKWKPTNKVLEANWLKAINSVLGEAANAKEFLVKLLSAPQKGKTKS